MAVAACDGAADAAVDASSIPGPMLLSGVCCMLLAFGSSIVGGKSASFYAVCVMCFFLKSLLAYNDIP